MKRFKKLTIYILVGVLLSSSVMLSYRKADEVKASATLTLGTGALIMLGILGAYGIVYKGNIDSALDEYVWKGDRGLYPHEVQEAEEWWAQMWDNTVRQYASNNGYDPDNWNDDDNDLETQPPLWEKVIGTVEKNKRPLKLLATAFGAIASKLAFGVYQESKNTTVSEGYVLNAGDSISYGVGICDSNGNISYHNKIQFDITKGADIYSILVGYKSGVYNYLKMCLFSTNKFYYNAGESSGDVSNGCNGWEELSVNSLISYGPSSVTYNGKHYYYGQYFLSYNRNYNSLAYTSVPIYEVEYNLSDTNFNMGRVFEEILNSDINWSDNSQLITEQNIGLGTNITIDNSNNELKPISPTITIPTASMLDKLLNDLESSYGNESGTQQAVDDFIADLEYTEPEPDPEPDPEPNPNPNPNPEGGGGTTTDPDNGGEGGSGSVDDEDNSSLLADLKNVFPFCIPFDLVNCFKLFNAEPVTPRVEIPLHFGIIDKDYTFVIDLKDFDGVAEVCRAMFLILFIVGLVLSTRSLIRG